MGRLVPVVMELRMPCPEERRDGRLRSDELGEVVVEFGRVTGTKSEHENGVYGEDDI